MAGRSGVEDHMIVARGRARIAKQLRELVEGSDLHGARSRKLFLHALEGRFRQNASVRPDNPVPVGLRGSGGVDVQSTESLRSRHRGRLSGEAHSEHFVQVRRRIRADQQYLLPAARQSHRGRARQRRLADTAFAREEQNPFRAVQEFRAVHGCSLPATTSGDDRRQIQTTQLHPGKLSEFLP